MKRDIPVKVFLTNEEATRLWDKANAAGLTEQQLIRALLKDYRPKSKPGDIFYETRGTMLTIAKVLSRLEQKELFTIDDKAQLHLAITELEQCIANMNQEFLGE